MNFFGREFSTVCKSNVVSFGDKCHILTFLFHVNFSKRHDNKFEVTLLSYLKKTFQICRQSHFNLNWLSNKSSWTHNLKKANGGAKMMNPNNNTFLGGGLGEEEGIWKILWVYLLNIITTYLVFILFMYCSKKAISKYMYF